MYVHQYAKRKPNQFTDSTVISTNVHPHSPPIQTPFYPKFKHFILDYLSIYIYISLDLYIWVNENPLAYRHISHPIYTSKLNAFNKRNMNLCSVPYLMKKSCHKPFSLCHNYSCRFPIALSSLIFISFFCPFYSKQILPKMLNDWHMKYKNLCHKWQTR